MSGNFNIKDVEELKNKNVLNENDNQFKLTNEYMKYIKGEENNYNKLKDLYDKEYVDINDNLYPTFNDPNFNIKISNKKEFLNTRYPDINAKDVEEYEEKVSELSQSKFELAPHQLFVKNFLSFETPYNSLLLYHGLGSGKTCSAIGVSEDMRVYLQQMNIQQKILIVASPNVQENFKLQLFDERKLKKNSGVWDLEGCTSNKLLKEINPVSIRGLTKEKIISTIKNLINNYYTFMGYTKFSLMIDKIESSLPKATKKAFKKKIQREFNNRLIIIDEIHNIRTSSTIDNKKIVKSLFKLVQNASNMKLLILSATPMYNDYKEIIWLLNLMNLNDNKSEILLKDVFDENGDFITKDGVEVGKNKFIEKTRGYVSFIRGENPYTFPHRIFPSQFSKKKTFMGDLKYPIQQINGKDISSEPMEIIDTYQVEIGEYQDIGYNFIANKINSRDNNLVGNDNLGYNILQGPIQALNIVYPCELLDNIKNNKNIDELDTTTSFIGKGGLHSIVSYDLNEEALIKNNYRYKENVIEKYGRIFQIDNIKKYSPKIYEICNHIINSTGIVLVYSQYIDGGLIPIALALEELGFGRYGNNKSLISKEEKNKEKIVPIDPITNNKITSFSKDSNKSSYIMITGDAYHSHNNSDEVKAVTNENNTNGEKIKVILLSKAGSEGIDFKNVRSVHIMDPWYNMNRQEQIIGRGVRNFSHSNLELKHRNTSIFLYGTLLKNKEIESIDNYIYRIAEKKAIQMGKITRLLKENSVDCLLNIKQKNYILENMNNIHIEQVLSNNSKIIHEIGDKPYSSTCDYMNNCDYKCLISKDDNIEYINKNIVKENKTTYNENYIIQNITPIIDKIKILFSSKYFYHKHDIIKELIIHKNYTMEEINYALDNLTFNKSEIIKDKYGFNGYIVNVGKYYYYQPYEINDEKISIFQRTVPIDIKNDKIKLTLDVEKEDENTTALSENIDILDKGSNIITKIKSDYDNRKTSTSFFFLIFKLFDKLNYSDDDMLVVFSHFLFDYLSFEEKGDISNYIYNKNEKDELETNIYNYIHNHFYLKHNEDEYLLFENKGVLGFYKKNTNENNVITWEEEGNYLNEYLENKIKEKYIFEKEHIINHFAKYIGYVVNIYDKKNDYNSLKFKLKFMKTIKGTGIICETYQKQFKLELINDFLFDDYKIKNNEELLVDSDIKGKPKQICMFIEMIFRHFENIKKERENTIRKPYKTNKWFLNPVETVINKTFKQLYL